MTKRRRRDDQDALAWMIERDRHEQERDADHHDDCDDEYYRRDQDAAAGILLGHEEDEIGAEGGTGDLEGHRDHDDNHRHERYLDRPLDALLVEGAKRSWASEGTIAG